jgi:hypothetical protein
MGFVDFIKEFVMFTTKVMIAGLGGTALGLWGLYQMFTKEGLMSWIGTIALVPAFVCYLYIFYMNQKEPEHFP